MSFKCKMARKSGRSALFLQSDIPVILIILFLVFIARLLEVSTLRCWLLSGYGLARSWHGDGRGVRRLDLFFERRDGLRLDDFNFDWVCSWSLCGFEEGRRCFQLV